MRKLFYAFLLISGFITLLLFYGDIWGTNRNKAVALTIWHAYVEQMSESISDLIQEFNDTIGVKEGIVVGVAVEANESSLNEVIMASVKRDPGAPPPPDMAVVYPRIAVKLAGLGVLTDIGALFTKDELERYVPQFLEEGMLGGDTLYILPIAKSTEVLYVNRTIFDRFSRDTGIDIELLATFEGIMEAAKEYHIWKTKRMRWTPGNSVAFFYPDAPFNFTMIGFEQLNDTFLKDNELNLNSSAFGRIWDNYFPQAVRGYIAIYDRFANYLAMTGDIVCATSSSAGAMFYPKTVFYPDNTKEDVTFDVLPYPVFRNGERVAVQRGAGLCILKSNAEKERAAAVFLKWLTDPAQNLRFTASTGYMPATKEAFDFLMTNELEGVENEYVRKTLKTIVSMRKDYRFYIPPVFEGFDELQKKYAARLISTAKDSRSEFERQRATSPDKDFNFAEKMRNFINEF